MSAAAVMGRPVDFYAPLRRAMDDVSEILKKLAGGNSPLRGGFRAAMASVAARGQQPVISEQQKDRLRTETRRQRTLPPQIAALLFEGDKDDEHYWFRRRHVQNTMPGRAHNADTKLRYAVSPQWHNDVKIPKPKSAFFYGGLTAAREQKEVNRGNSVNRSPTPPAPKTAAKGPSGGMGTFMVSMWTTTLGIFSPMPGHNNGPNPPSWLAGRRLEDIGLK